MYKYKKAQQEAQLEAEQQQHTKVEEQEGEISK